MLLSLISFILMVSSQDPAPGWLGYATAQCPAGTKITHMEALWKVGALPIPSGAFFSPWFGIDTSDNMNLLQPVNPWFGSAPWQIYTEYYQWSDGYNSNSEAQSANPGDTLLGRITYMGDGQQAYKIIQTDTTSQVSSSQVQPVQQDGNGVYKNYTIAYVVYEKVNDCNEYPPDGQVTFTSIRVFCNGTQITPQWTTSYVEDVCNNRAHVIAADTIRITWDTSAPNPTKEQKARNGPNAFGRTLRPQKSKPLDNA